MFPQGLRFLDEGQETGTGEGSFKASAPSGQFCAQFLFQAYPLSVSHPLSLPMHAGTLASLSVFVSVCVRLRACAPARVRVRMRAYVLVC